MQENLMGEKAFRTYTIKSYSFKEDEILKAILNLYCNSEYFDLDPTYSIGNFYKNIHKPRYCSDIKPQLDFVEEMSSDNLRFENNSINSICFDPPFLIGYGNCENNKNISAVRFGIFKYYKDLLEYYSNSVKEFNRVLKKDGILAFKTQDYSVSSNKSYCLHNDVYNICKRFGFEFLDLFVLLSKCRIDNKYLEQRHSRKYHTYWYVFKNKLKIQGNNDVRTR